MVWLRKMPIYAVVLLILAVLIAGAGLGYFAVATFGSTIVTGQQNSGGSGEPYEWDGQRLYLRSVDSTRDSSCVITGRDGAQRSLRVPRNSNRRMFSSPDFAEVAPQPGSTATIICSRTVSVFAGDAAVRARTVNSRLFRMGIPALVAIPVLAAIGIPLRRRTRGGQPTS